MIASCDSCASSYATPPSHFARSIRHYCSQHCQFAARTGAVNPHWRGGKIERKCKTCSKTFFCFPSMIKRNRANYCSQPCKVTSHTIYPSAVIRHREGVRRRDVRQRAAKNIKTHTHAEWVALLARHDGRCMHCGTRERITRDHITPISKGGDDGITNIQPLCHSCNCRKHDNI